MKNRNMKWISFVTVLVMIFVLLAPMTFAEGDIAVPENATEEIADAVDSDTKDAVAKDDATEYNTPKMIFEPINFVNNLGYMAKGMLGIFVVIGVIVLATACLNKLFKDKKQD